MLLVLLLLFFLIGRVFLDELLLYHNKLTKIYSGTSSYNDFGQS